MENDFGKKVRHYRKEADKTQKELADFLGYKTSSSVAKIEDGTNDVPVSVAVRIAEFLGISPKQFFEPIPENSWGQYRQYFEYLPHLAEAEEGDLRSIRKILGMPVEEKKSDGRSISRA